MLLTLNFSKISIILPLLKSCVEEQENADLASLNWFKIFQSFAKLTLNENLWSHLSFQC